MSAKRKTKYDEALRLYNEGLSTIQLSKRFGVCLSAMYKALSRRGCHFRPTDGGKPKICTVDGCGGSVKANGYCARHSYQFYKYGEIISVKHMRQKDRICSVDGCGKKHRSNGYCDGHLSQHREHGKIISVNLRQRDGVSRDSAGYVFLLKPGHQASNKRGYVRRSHLVWEKNTGHTVTPPEVIHHKNGIKNDDRFENLELFANDNIHQSTRHRITGRRGVVPGGIII